MKKLSEADKDFLSDTSLTTLANPSRKSHIIFFVSLLFFIIIVFWAYYFQIDETTRGLGKVIPSSQIQVIQNLEGGIVKKIFVKEGQSVTKGQPLMQIDDTRFSSSYRESEIKAMQLKITILRLTATIDSKKFIIPSNLSKTELKNIHYEKALFQSQKNELIELRNNHRLADKELQMTRPLVSKGAASPVEVLRLQRTCSQLKGEIAKFRSKILDELNDAKAELAALKEKIITSKDRLTRTTVRSPVKGIIKRILITTETGVVQPGMDLVEIVPLDDTLLIEAKINPRDVGFLHPGLNAKVTLTAYDFSEYGGLEGKLEHISSDAIQDDKTKAEYYLIRVRTQKNYLGTKSHPLYIIPGMIANVDIITGKKTVLNYILNPVLRGLNKALTEK